MVAQKHDFCSCEVLHGFYRPFQIGLGIEPLCVMMNLWKIMSESLRSELKGISCPLCVCGRELFLESNVFSLTHIDSVFHLNQLN